MKVGVPKEVKNREYRVALTPIGVHELVQHGQVAARARTVLVQMDPATGRSTPLPERVRAALEGVVVPDPDPDPDPAAGPVTVRA